MQHTAMQHTATHNEEGRILYGRSLFMYVDLFCWSIFTHGDPPANTPHPPACVHVIYVDLFCEIHVQLFCTNLSRTRVFHTRTHTCKHTHTHTGESFLHIHVQLLCRSIFVYVAAHLETLHIHTTHHTHHTHFVGICEHWSIGCFWLKIYVIYCIGIFLHISTYFQIFVHISTYFHIFSKKFKNFHIFSHTSFVTNLDVGISEICRHSFYGSLLT